MTAFRPRHIGYAAAAWIARGPLDRTNAVDPVTRGALLGREHVTAQLTPLPPAAPALPAGG
jgi:hypothetical protein